CRKGGKRKGKGSKERTGTSKELIAEKRTFYFAEIRTNLVDVDKDGRCSNFVYLYKTKSPMVKH
ncbi:MAG: hypothetical protein M0Z32_04700, partial [Actinomycetota bacterium]|nr:hypothetical protein [Actinomycetota bacterium]